MTFLFKPFSILESDIEEGFRERIQVAFEPFIEDDNLIVDIMEEFDRVFDFLTYIGRVFNHHPAQPFGRYCDECLDDLEVLLIFLGGFLITVELIPPGVPGDAIEKVGNPH
jgi:hypothetical protein